MLTSLTFRNFKQFGDVRIELGNPVVFIGPNNSGKTTALQALALWDVGLRRWNEKRKGQKTPEKRPGVPINRRDLTAIPVANANLLWRNLRVRSSTSDGGKQQTSNIRIDVLVEGVTNERPWRCGLEFDYANEESFHCRPLRVSDGKQPERMPVPEEASDVRVGFLGPMSGLAATEPRLDPGAINVLLGEGRTAEVLRNLCYQVLVGGDSGRERWEAIKSHIQSLFGDRLDDPEYVPERGELTMSYHAPDGSRLDLSSAGRGLQQTLLLLAYLGVNPNTVLLFDEPDAHLEILRQRQIYSVLTQAASASGSQLIIASHSEVILNEAADRDVVVAFLGRPHRIDDRGQELLKSLREIGFDQYYQAEQTGWVLYLEGSTDLDILRSLAEKLGHLARHDLERPFVTYVGNQWGQACRHFDGLREAKGDLVAFALFDRLPRSPEDRSGMTVHVWAQREIENYLCERRVLIDWAKHRSRREGLAPLFTQPWAEAMDTAIDEITQALQTLGEPSPWSADIKASDVFLARVFRRFFEILGLPNLMNKSSYHELATHVPANQIDPEVIAVLDGIHETAGRAQPVQA